MLLDKNNSQLLVIDIQSRLAPAIHKGEEVIKQACWVIEVARQLNVPITATEQYPKGIGTTVEEVKQLLKPEEILQKMHFSAMQEAEIAQHLASKNKQQVVVLGTEAHVCVLQTAAELLGAGYEVFLVAEALGSRKKSSKKLALKRLKQQGAQVITREMLAFEWLHVSGTEEFKHLIRNYIK